MTNEIGIKTILVFNAHPDDTEIGCGGTVVKFAEEGNRVILVIMTNGEKGSSDNNNNFKKLISIRKKETQQAAEFMGVEKVVHLNYPDGELEDNKKIRGQVVKLIRIYRPDIIIVPDPTAIFFDNYINHSDHRTAGWIVVNSLIPAGNWNFYRNQFTIKIKPHNVSEIYFAVSREPNWAVDISGTFEKKVKALSFHESQVNNSSPTPFVFFQTMLKNWAEESGKKHKMKYAEEFRRIVFKK